MYLHSESRAEGRVSPRINVGIVACGGSIKDAIVLIKSVVMFSRDSNLNLVIFGDKTLPQLAASVIIKSILFEHSLENN